MWRKQDVLKLVKRGITQSFRKSEPSEGEVNYLSNEWSWPGWNSYETGKIWQVEGELRESTIHLLM